MVGCALFSGALYCMAPQPCSRATLVSDRQVLVVFSGAGRGLLTWLVTPTTLDTWSRGMVVTPGLPNDIPNRSSKRSPMSNPCHV